MRKLFVSAVALAMLAGLSTAVMAASGQPVQNIAVVPEPTGIAVCIMGLGSLVGFMRLRKK